MCNIAGYVGTKPAAPILIDMLRREEGFGGGYYTGIATIHEGKLHYAKLTGDVQRLVDLTEAASLPGTVGIIHGRSNSGGGDEWAHPFIGMRDGVPVQAYAGNGITGCFCYCKFRWSWLRSGFDCFEPHCNNYICNCNFIYLNKEE